MFCHYCFFSFRLLQIAPIYLKTISVNELVNMYKGDRWDIIANKFLDDMYKMDVIIAENPHVPITDTIEEGTILKIPKIEKDEIKSGLPIWKQQNQ